MLGIDHDKYEHIHEDGLVGIIPMFLRNPFTQVGSNWTGFSFGEVDFTTPTSGQIYFHMSGAPLVGLGYSYIFEMDVGWTGPDLVHLATFSWFAGSPVLEMYSSRVEIYPGQVYYGARRVTPNTHPGGWGAYIRAQTAGTKIKSAWMCIYGRP
jgi:hypothetical protein